MGTSYVDAILLGLLQGIAEFLPISSSGHLVVAGAILERVWGREGTAEESLQLNIALHAGTLLSILWVYRQQLRGLFSSPRTYGLLAITTLPLVVLGLTVKDHVEQVFETPLYAGCGWLATSLLLLWTTTFNHERDGLENVGWWQAGVVGLFQAFAILPGVSRSGSTIAGGLWVGLDRRAATTFSFLIAIPAISGATVLLVKDVVTAPEAVSRPAESDMATDVPTETRLGPLLVGAVVACLVGVASLEALVRIVQRGGLHWFAAYCGLAGVATIVWQLAT